MYTIEDLFDKRSVVGTKLEQLLLEKSYTKTKLCKDAVISRPTLDKLLAGTLTNKTNYEKHISKILNCLSVTPGMILGNIQNEHNRTRTIRNALRITSETVSEYTRLSMNRLEAIESGEQATTAELRDIALCLSTSVRSLSGTNFFETQIATLDYFVAPPENTLPDDLSGFWGHIGILPTNTNQYLWYPITGSTRVQICQSRNEERMVVPCMNNKVLLLNMSNIDELILLDEACDAPDFANWDPNVDCGETPLVIYEALEDYWYYMGQCIPFDILSSNFQTILQNYITSKELSEDAIYQLTNQSVIYYKDNKTRQVCIDFDFSENISDEIFNVFTFTDSEVFENTLFFTDDREIKTILNLRNIALLEIPLLKLEKTLFETLEETCR